MATVDVLIAGHVQETDAGQSVHPTVSLVRDQDLVVVVDPGMLSDPALLTDALAQRRVSVADVTHVFVTHHHLDHTRNVGLFAYAWWFADMTPVLDPLAWDQASLERSRERILAIADIVVPGHGPAFRPATGQTPTHTRTEGDTTT